MKKVIKKEIKGKKSKLEELDDEDFENDDDFDQEADHEDDVIEDESHAATLLPPKKVKAKKKIKEHIKGSGSLFIPKRK